MKITILKSIKSACLVLVGLVIGVILGLREGGLAFMYLDGIPRGVLATGELKAINAGNLKLTKDSLETEIDQALYFHSLIQEQWWYPLYKANFLYGGSPSDHTMYVKKVAGYRVANPGTPIDPAMFDEVPKGKEEYKEFYHELALSHRDRIRRIEETKKAYAGK